MVAALAAPADPVVDVTTEFALAHLESALSALASLIAVIRSTGGYLRHDHQVDLRHAEALIAEMEGRR